LLCGVRAATVGTIGEASKLGDTEDRGVMSPQEAMDVSLIKVTSLSGKGTLGTWWCHGQRGAWTQSREKADVGDGTKGRVNHLCRGVCEPALDPRCGWEGSLTRGQDFQPDLGNSAVRHDRGASENVAMAEW